jgi:hypothetical protein
MTITRTLFDAYLRCPTKCWLLSRGEPVSEHHVAAWTASQDVAYRDEAITKLRGAVRFEPGGPTLHHNATGLQFQAASALKAAVHRDRRQT